MKAGTKALLASMMVLALALSSIGGVTYSWFSGSQEIGLDSDVATLDVEISVYLKSGDTKTLYDWTRNDLRFDKGASTTYEIVVENNSSIPIDLKMDVQSSCYQAINDTDVVAFLVPTDEGYELANSEWGDVIGKARDYITFNGSKPARQDSFDVVDGNGGSITDGTITQTYTAIRLLTYFYTICDMTLQAGEKKTYPLTITADSSYDEKLLKDYKLEIGYSQTGSIIKTIGSSNVAKVNGITWPNDICFSGQGITIRIPKETIGSVNPSDNVVTLIADSVTVTVTKDTVLKVELSFSKGENTVTPNTGVVMIGFDYNGVSGYISAPVSEEYVLYTFNTGGSS